MNLPSQTAWLLIVVSISRLRFSSNSSSFSHSRLLARGTQFFKDTGFRLSPVSTNFTTLALHTLYCLPAVHFYTTCFSLHRSFAKYFISLGLQKRLSVLTPLLRLPIRPSRQNVCFNEWFIPLAQTFAVEEAGDYSSELLGVNRPILGHPL